MIKLDVVGAAYPGAGDAPPPVSRTQLHPAARSAPCLIWWNQAPLLSPAHTVLSTWNAVLPLLPHLADCLHVLHGPTPMSPPGNLSFDCPQAKLEVSPSRAPTMPSPTPLLKLRPLWPLHLLGYLFLDVRTGASFIQGLEHGPLSISPSAAACLGGCGYNPGRG